MNQRILQIDAIRGFIMLLMTLDHTRDFLGNTPYDATDLTRASAALFFSRWITHICATGFILLAGISLVLKKTRDSPRETIYFAFSRGILFIVIEQTILRCAGWYFNFDYRFMNAGILWGIGWSLILCVPLIAMNERYALFIGIFLTLLLAIPGVATLSDSWIFKSFVSGGDITFLPEYHFYVSYPILPWFAVLCLGIGLSRFLISRNTLHATRATGAGILFLCLFVLFRLNGIGDAPALVFPDATTNLLSFINLTKYPPSLCFVLMTAGLILCMLGTSSVLPGKVIRLLSIPGKMPFLYYVMHIPTIHLLALGLAYVKYGRAEWLYNGPGIFWFEALPGHPPGYGYALPIVYAVAALVFLFLSFVTRILRAGWKEDSKFRFTRLL